MIKGFMAILALSVFCAQASAEILYCRFHQSGQPISLLKWNTNTKTVETITGADRTRQVFQDVDTWKGLEPYDDGKKPVVINTVSSKQKKKGFSLVVLGDVPAIHLRLKKSTHWEDKCLMYPYEAYWGLIKGTLKPMNWFDEKFMSDAGVKGVCWSKTSVVKEKMNCSDREGGGNGGDKAHRNNDNCKRGKNGEHQSPRGNNNGNRGGKNK